MARPKLSEDLKKVRLNLTVSKETKEMLDFIRNYKNVSISELLDTTISKEYKKLQRELQKENKQ